MSSGIGQIIIGLVFGVIGLIGSTATVVWFISKQFSDGRSLIYAQIAKLGENIIQKLEYHEKHDDERFQSLIDNDNKISDRIWNLELKLALKNAEDERETKAAIAKGHPIRGA